MKDRNTNAAVLSSRSSEVRKRRGDSAGKMCSFFVAAACAFLNAHANGGRCESYEATVSLPIDCGFFSEPIIPLAIASNGNVGGYFRNCANGEDRAMIWQVGGSTVTNLHVWGPDDRSYTQGVNRSGVAVGYVSPFSGPARAFARLNGVVQELPLPRGTADSAAEDVNDQGIVVGWFNPTISTPPKACRWVNEQIEVLNVQGKYSAYAEHINDDGDICGFKTIEVNGSASEMGFLWKDGIATDLGIIPDGLSSRSSSINNHDEIVGSGILSINRNFIATDRAFYWSEKTGMV
ncbi:MAG TPA: hypothetical protein VG711_07950, partial [Phycisphaerales bacterium]|nr:hypothetical protein [Phycisphaerales bacterium]